MSLQEALNDAYETANLYHRYLHLGYFYSELSKRVNLSRIAPNINIETGEGQGYHLQGKLIRAMLDDIYNKPKITNLFEYITLLDSVRGIVMALREALEDKEFQDVFRQRVFQGNEEEYLHFDGVARFIRNVLSHNIKDKVIIAERDIGGQRRWWQERKGNSPIVFQYDYSSPQSAIHIPNYPVKVNIRIDWQAIAPGATSYFEVIDIRQNLMFAEFCYNALSFLQHAA